MSQITYLKRAGTFKAKVVPRYDSWFSESAKGTPYINLTIEVIEGPESGSATSWTGYLSEKAEDHTLKNLAVAFPGWPGIHDIDSLIGRELEIVVEEEVSETNGNTYYKVVFINPIGGAPRRAGLDPSKAKSLIARLQGKSKAIVKQVATEKGEVTGDATYRAPAASSENLENLDDIPF